MRRGAFDRPPQASGGRKPLSGGAAQRLYAAGLLVGLFLFSGFRTERVAQAQTASPLQAFGASKAAQQPAAPAAAPSEQGIPLPQIADQAEQLDQRLQQIAKQMTPTQELRDALRAAEAQAEEIGRRAREVDQLLAGTPSVVDLTDDEQYWRSLGEQYASQRKLLTSRADVLEKQAAFLDEQQAKWQATLDQIHRVKGMEAVVDRTRQQVDAIRVARSQTQDQLSLVLTLQNRVSQQNSQVSEVLAKIQGELAGMRGRVLERDSHPLWEARELRKFDQPMKTLVRHSVGRQFETAKDFLRVHMGRVVGITLLYLLGLGVAFKLGGYVRHGILPGIRPEAAQIFARPFAVAALVALLGTFGMVTRAPTPIAFVVYLLYVIPALRLLPPLLEPGVRIFVYVLTGFYVLNGILVMIQVPAVLERELFALMILAALTVFGWLARPSRLRQLQLPARTRLLLTLGVRAGMLLLLASLVANALGYLALSQVLGAATLLGAFVAAALYNAYSVLSLILATALRSQGARSLPEEHRQAVERWSRRILGWGAALLVVRVVLHLFGVAEVVIGAASNALQYPIGFNRVHVSLGGVLSFTLILFVGYALANSITLLLQKFLFSRLPLQRGLPYAISKVIYYILLVVVFLAALTDAGVELNKFTVVTGAVGVGVGFGLQNIVNNFASGLILLFERPIRVGDIVEVGGLSGTVKRIGARSSTVETFQEAEVIVPNSTLVANQVINWTLSSPRRRAEIPVGVAYGTDPEQVLKLLVEVAESNPEVLRYPRPSAFFLGFGESALNFELRFWAGQDTWFQLKSDVTISLARALRDAGIEIPFPQRDLHLRSVDSSVKEALATLPDRSVVD